MTEREWVEEIGRASSWAGEVVPVAAEDLSEAPRQPFDFRYELMTDTTRVRKELGYGEPLDREEALRRTVEWERLQRSHSGRNGQSSMR